MEQYTTHRVVIIEDNVELNNVLGEYIKTDDNLFLVASYTNCEKAIKNLAVDRPKVVLMDIDLPGMNGVEGTKKIKSLFPKTEVIIITVFENNETVFSALSAGASGYLTKNLSQEDLLSSISECISGGAPMSMKIARMIVGSFKKNNKSPLTERETEVLAGLSSGKSYNSVALHLSISKDTVKYHIKNIYIKLSVDNKEDAIEIANKERFI